MVARVDYSGLSFIHSKYGEYKVVSFKDSKDVSIRFTETGYEYSTTIQQIRKGCVKDKIALGREFNGFCGLYDFKGDTSSIEYKKALNLWSDMMNRCFNVKKLSKASSYAICGVSDEFTSFSSFYSWCVEQNYFNVDGYVLDKDLLSFGKDKVYSRETCAFIPNRLNNMLPSFLQAIATGVKHTLNRNGYSVRVYENGNSIYLGTYKQKSVADKVYLDRKIKYVKCYLESIKEEVDLNVYYCLNNLLEFKNV